MEIISPYLLPAQYIFHKNLFSSSKIKAFRGFNHMLPSPQVRQKSQQHELHSDVILGLESSFPPHTISINKFHSNFQLI